MNKTQILRILAAFLCTLLALALAGCAMLGGDRQEEAAQVETPAPGRVPADAVQLDLNGMELTGDEIAALLQSTALASLDVRNTNLTKEQVQQLLMQLPNCEILWSVPFGGTTVDSNAASVTADASVDAAALDAALSNLPALTAADLHAANVSTDDVLAMLQRYPNVRFAMNATVCGVAADTAATELDLSGATGFTADALLAALPLFPDMVHVNLSGQPLSFDEMDALTGAYPALAFDWSFSYLDMTVHSSDSFLDLSNRTIGNAEMLAQTLSYLPGLTRLDLCGCDLTNEQMGALREQFPNIAIHWTITVGRWTMRTDATAFSTGQEHTTTQVTYDRKGGSKTLKTADIQPLQYCTEMVALDIGHQKIDDISVVSNMKKLRFLIIADGDFTDITPIASCTELEFLEVFQNYIADFSPLLPLTKLKCLNVGATKSPDKSAESAAALERLSVLKQLRSLARLWCIHAGFDKAMVADLQSALPDCAIVSGGTHPTSNGWRKDNELYREMQGLFELKVLD